jgi:hypothetical protein
MCAPQPNPGSRMQLVHAATATADTVGARSPGALAMLLSNQLLQSGELVLLIVKPSLWFIFLSSLRFIAVVLILMIASTVLDPHLPGHNRTYIETGAFVLAGRLMWAALQWMGRLYVLTNMRIVRLAGVLNVEVFDCPLRKIARTHVARTIGERILNLGSIEIIPSDVSISPAIWQTVAHPVQVHEQIVAAISKCRHNGHTSVAA